MIVAPKYKKDSGPRRKFQSTRLSGHNARRLDLGIGQDLPSPGGNPMPEQRLPLADIYSEQTERGRGFVIQLPYRSVLFTGEEERAIFRLLRQRMREVERLRTADSQQVCQDRQPALIAAENAVLDIRNAIIEANLRLVVSVAKRFTGKGLPDLSELVSEGNSVLMKAVDRFDPEFGTRFSTYATTALKRAYIGMLKATHRHQQRFTTGVPIIFEAIEDESSPISETSRHYVMRDAKKLLGQLNSRERKIVEGRFGLLEGSEPKSFRELGESLGLSRERVRQLLVSALQKLRRYAEKNRISPPEVPA